MCGEVRAGRREGTGWRRRKWHAREGPDSRLWGPRARAERTRNISRMSVTLDVSKLSGWLNASACCRVERRACAMRGEVRPGRCEGVGWRRRYRRAREGPDSRLGGQGTRGAHHEHVAHACDLGRVEAERLVERPRRLPSRKACMRRGKRYTVREVCGGVGRCSDAGVATHMHGKGPTQGCGSQGTRGAHLEHVAHVRDAGRVEADRLVELDRVLPSRKAGMRRGTPGRRAGGVGWRRRN